MTAQLKIIPFESKYALDFTKLNIEWLEKYFVVEPHDLELLKNCETSIIGKGGFIFFAQWNGQIIGTYSLLKLNDFNFELGKMAVSPKLRGRAVGQKLMSHCLQFGKTQRLESIVLYTSSKLNNALHIYRKFGFKDIPLEENAPYARSDVKMIYTY